MNWNKWLRQTHRWLSIAFNVGRHCQRRCCRTGEVHHKLGLWAVATLALQFFTGLYLSVLPNATGWRSARRTG